MRVALVDIDVVKFRVRGQFGMDFFVSMGYLGNVKMTCRCIVYYIILYSCTNNVPYLVHFFFQIINWDRPICHASSV